MKTRSVMALAALALAIPLAAAAGPADKAGARVAPDANKDGFLSRTEAQAAADQRFARLDANSDGKLMPGERPERPGREGRGAERMGPPDGGPGGPRGPRRMGPGSFGVMNPATFEEYDANRDGGLSKAEFRKHALRTFDARDGNGDGKVAMPERGRMQGERGHHGGRHGDKRS